MKKYLNRIVLGLLITGVFLAYNKGQIQIDLLDRLELLAYDARLKATTPAQEIDPRVVIIDIDERSLAEQGHWPWNRAKLAKLLNNLFEEYGIDIVGFDVVFAERDSSEELELLEELAIEQGDSSFLKTYQALKPQVNPDKVFANSMRDRNVVLGYYFDKSKARSTFTSSIGEPLFSKGNPFYDALNLQKKLGDEGFIEAEITSFTGNVSELQLAALDSGFYSIGSIDKDGILRRIQLLEKFDGGLYQSLAVALTRHYLQSEVKIVTTLDENGDKVVEGLDLGTGLVPMDREGTTYIPYKGRAFNFRYIPASDVLNKTVKQPEDLEYAIAIVGTTAAGLVDLRNSPLQQNNYPGVEVHAATIIGMLDGEFRARPYYSTAAEFLILLFLGVTLSLLLPPLGAMGESITLLLTNSVLVAGNLYLWVQHSTIMSLAPALTLVALLYILNTTYGYLFESRAKLKLGALFGQYVPPELVDEMTKNPESYNLEARKENLTVLFTDVRGFTTISEGLNPTELSDLMNEFLSAMTRVVHEYGGTIDKYMGDAMMAFWGAPMENTNHARDALLAAIEMGNALEDVNVRFAEKGWPPIKIGIGLNSGDMHVGNMGSEFRMAYTVLGDAVNLGSRVEGITKNYGVEILVTEFTAQAAPEFDYQRIDSVRVKGKLEPVTLMLPLGVPGEVNQDKMIERDDFHRALDFYLDQSFTQAKPIFKALLQNGKMPVLYQAYVDRCDEFEKNPPGESWDGVFTLTSK